MLGVDLACKGWGGVEDVQSRVWRVQVAGKLRVCCCPSFPWSAGLGLRSET